MTDEPNPRTKVTSSLEALAEAIASGDKVAQARSCIGLRDACGELADAMSTLMDLSGEGAREKADDPPALDKMAADLMEAPGLHLGAAAAATRLAARELGNAASAFEAAALSDNADYGPAFRVLLDRTRILAGAFKTGDDAAENVQAMVEILRSLGDDAEED